MGIRNTLMTSSIARSDFHRSMRPSTIEDVHRRAADQGTTLSSSEARALSRADLNHDGTIGNSAAERRAAWRVVDGFDRDGHRGSVDFLHGRGYGLARALAPELNPLAGITAARSGTSSGPSVTMGGPTTVSYSGVPDISGERLTPRGGRWDSAAILDRLGQYDNTTAPATQGERCGAATSLAGAILGGRSSTARYADGLAAATDGGDSTAARAIAGRVRRGTATYGDMHRLQDISYRMANRDGRPDLSIRELSDVSRSTGGHSVTGTGMSPTETASHLRSLRPGESFTMLLSRAEGDPPSATGHYVRAGRDASGREFIYDPGLRDGHHLIYRDRNPEAFSGYLERRGITTEPRYRATDAALARAEAAGLMELDPSDASVRARLRAVGVEVVNRPINRVIE